MYCSPFEHPYSATGGQAAAGAASLPRPTLVIPDGDDSPPAHDHPTTSHSTNNESPEHSRPPGQRRVQWPADLSEHVSIQMASPTSRTLTDEGGQDALTRALEEHSKHPELPFDRRYIGQSGSEAPSRAASSDGDPEERLEEMREQMDVYVDPGETDGLPTTGSKGIEAKANKAAWGLVRGYTSGGFGFRQRKNAGFKGGKGEAGDQEKGDVVGEKDDGGFFTNPFKPEGDLSSTDPPNSGRAPQAAGAPGGGILSALIALQQQQQQQGGASGATSGATTPTSLAPSRNDSTAYNSEDDEDEEEERLKFLRKQREKRANRTALQNVVDGGVGLGKGVAGGALGIVGGVGKNVMGGASHVVGGAGKAVGLTGHSRGHSRGQSGDATPARVPGSGTPPTKKKTLFGEAAGGLKNLGGKLGLEIDAHDRPEAARSGAGVFGALTTSTVRPSSPMQSSDSS